MDCMQCRECEISAGRGKVSIPQAVWIACNSNGTLEMEGNYSFQYRKRYGLHAILASWNNIFVLDEFQYRKRYGLHAMELSWKISHFF